MKIERLQELLIRAQTQFPKSDIEIADGYLSLNLKETPTQDQIDSVPTAEYEECQGIGPKVYRTLRIWGD